MVMFTLSTKQIDIAKLDLSRNSIEDLPLQLSSCASRETLNLSRNKIKVWPNVILKSLQNLVCLKLDSNPLIKIPSDGFEAASKLQILDLSGYAGCLPEYPSFSIDAVTRIVFEVPKARKKTSNDTLPTEPDGTKLQDAVVERFCEVLADLCGDQNLRLQQQVVTILLFRICAM
ncbi:hypothetical protein L2E82_19518 [Cichorium intybus]|uniref:Uncharacterized protein n=1 Tax=Cichorium intybus TaxID=13427 RepID=A0ACB9FCN8_CICIN|nr:hypothetical protein L2E82_19518 [Cichorium intybus]